MSDQQPVLYFHCKKCIKDDLRTDVSIGASADGNLIVWCETHQEQVAKFALKNPFDMSKMKCGECGTPLDGRQHSH